MNNELVPTEDPFGSHRAGLLKALRAHYGDGKNIKDAFATEDTPSRALYYKLKAAHPNEMLALEEEARQLGLKRVRQVLTSLDAKMLSKSVVARGMASDALLEAIPQLKAIALGATFTVDVPKPGGDGVYQKVVLSRPSAQVKAAEMLLRIAREGLTTLETTEKVSFVDESGDKEPQRESSLRPLGVPIDFSEVSATLPDGSRITITKEQEQDVIEGEVTEVDASEETPTPSD